MHISSGNITYCYIWKSNNSFEDMYTAASQFDSGSIRIFCERVFGPTSVEIEIAQGYCNDYADITIIMFYDFDT